MTAFLVALLLALLAGGGLVVLWQQRRHAFWWVLGVLLVSMAATVTYVLRAEGPRLLPVDQGPLLSNLVLEPVAGSYRIRGTVRNRATDMALSTLPLTLVVEDCDRQGHCRDARQTTVELWISLPPGGTRDFQQVFHIKPTPADLELRWRLETGAPRLQPVAG